MITLRFFGALRHASGAETITVKCREGASLMELLNDVTIDKPSLRRNLLDEQLAEAKPHALIFVNGREISVLNGLETKVKDEDEIVFVPVVHGG